MSRQPARKPSAVLTEHQHCTAAALSLSRTLHTTVSRNQHSLQQAKELPVVLIALPFGYQAVQLIDQFGLHLDEGVMGYKLAVRVEDKSTKHLEDWKSILFLMPWGCPLLRASDLFLCGSVKRTHFSHFAVKQDENKIILLLIVD